MEQRTKGIFYGVGVGPGDPELMTLKAVRILEESPVLAAPRTPAGDCLALSIARGAARLEEKEILFLDFSMSRNKDIQMQAHQRAVEQVKEKLSLGLDVAMVVLGDVSIFSTYCYLTDLLKQDGYPCQMIPGIPSFCAVAARLGRSITEMNRPLHIIPAGGVTLEEALQLPGSKVLMKSGKSLPRVVETLKQCDLAKQSAMVQDCGLPTEQAWDSLEGMVDAQGYFTTILVP